MMESCPHEKSSEFRDISVLPFSVAKCGGIGIEFPDAAQPTGVLVDRYEWVFYVP